MLRRELLRIASNLPQGNATRREILAALKDATPRFKLEKGKQYRVTRRGAKLSWDVSTGPWAWTYESVKLPKGAVLTYVGSVRGRGSDSVHYDHFTYKRQSGAFNPEFWGSADRDYLEPV